MALPAKLAGAFGVACALGLMLSACSLAAPPDHSFTAINAKQPNQPDKTAMEQASKACKDKTRDKGIKSVLAIVTRLRPGAVDEDYIACMKDEGYTVAK
jgi:hypothetical protein